MGVEEAKCLTAQIGEGGLGIELLLKKLLPNPPSLDPSLDSHFQSGSVLPSHSLFRAICASVHFPHSWSSIQLPYICWNQHSFLSFPDSKSLLWFFSSPTFPLPVKISSVVVSERCQEKGMQEAVLPATLTWKSPCNFVSCLRKQNTETTRIIQSPDVGKNALLMLEYKLNPSKNFKSCKDKTSDLKPVKFSLHLGSKSSN